MKVKQLYQIIVLFLLFVPAVVFAQPNLGTTAEFSLFTSTGDVTNTGSSQIIGNIGTNFGSITGFSNINGTTHDSDGTSTQGAVDLAVLYNDLNTSVATFFPAAALGNGQVLTPGVYSIATGATLTGDLTLDAQGDPNAVFIIRINGGLTSAADAEVILLDGAAACNVFWQVEGDVALASGTIMKGTIVANNSDIDMDASVSLEGRALANAGAITVDDILTYTPAGCGAPLLTGPGAPNLLSAACYAVLAVDDNITNTGVSIITGEVGSDNGASVGFDPLFISGTLHLATDASTTQAATDFMNAYTYASGVAADIEIMFPAVFGNSLILTPHTYLINASATLSDTLFIDAQNNSSAVFLIQVNGDLTTMANSHIVLLNGADADNIYWEVDGNVTIGANSTFVGTIMANNGAVNVDAGAEIEGHVFNTNGAINVTTSTITIPTLCSPVITAQPIDQTICEGGVVNFSVTATGAGLTYQWTRGGVNLVDGGNISGATTSTLTITGLTTAEDATDYNVIVSGDYEPAATSDNTALIVNTPPDITVQPVDVAVCSGDAASFTVTATGSALTYQWMRGGLPMTDAGNVSGTTTSTLTIDPVGALDVASDYSVLISGACPSDAASVEVALDINSGVAITTAPVDVSACEGSSATFSVVATGTGLTYQWTRNGVNLTDGGSISGATGASLTIDPVAQADEFNDYNVIITGACGNMTSANVELTVDEAPAITVQPTDQTICEGNLVNFMVTATGTGLTYQWRQGTNDMVDGARVTGATTSSLIIDPTLAADAAPDYNVVVTGSCGSSITSVNAELIINTPPVITVQPVDEAVCETNIINIPVTATGTGLTYQWRRGAVNLADIGTISGSTTSILTISPVALSDAGADYNVVVTGACGSSVTSVDMEITVNTAPQITMEPIDRVGCEGGTVTFTVAATGTDLTYQWYKDGLGLVDAGSVSGVMTTALTINPINSIDASTDYYVVVTGLCPAEDTSAHVSLSINTPPVITLQPVNESVCPGGSATFTVGATGNGLTYQWTRGGVNLADGGNISGATTSTLTIDPVAGGDVATDYAVIVSGSCPVPVISADVSLSFDASPAITVQPVDATVCEGTSASMTVTATGAGLTYQWMRGGVALVNGGNISGANSPTLTINPATSADADNDYSVMVSGNCPVPVTSVNVDLIINTAPVITVQPVGVTVCDGSAATFTVTATGTGLTYQWMRGGMFLADNGSISGVTTSSLTIDPATTADIASDYNVVVTGTCGVALTSVDATLVVNTSPAITVQPSDRTVCEGSAATFIVTATGGNLNYQWRRGAVNLVDGGNISGATTSTLTIDPAMMADADNDYNVVITGSCPGTATSVNVDLVIETTPIITIQPVDRTVCEGTSVTFDVTTSASGLTYQWRQGSVNMVDGPRVSGATTSSLTINPVNSGDAATNYNVVISGTCPTSTTSVNVSLTVNTPPVITLQPTDQNACPGEAVTFEVQATGSGLTYQWMLGGVALADGGNISGATTSMLTIDPVAAIDGAVDYHVVVTGACPAAVNSVDAQLIINNSPVITVQPINLSVCDGGSVSFNVTSPGAGLTYQWMRGGVALVNGGNISGATSSTLTINPATAADAATDYSVVVTGACPTSTTSVDVSLTINTAPVITVQPVDQTVCEGLPISFTVGATGTGLTYQWRQGTNDMIDGPRVSGATTSTLTIDPTMAADAAPDYNVVVSGTCGTSAVSLNADLIINTAPAISIQPVDASACEGGFASFTVSATGSGLTYQWMVGGVNLADGGNISGATSSTLVINPTSIADAATDYSVMVSGACPVALTSVDVELVINPTPVINVQPVDASVCDGSAATFTVTAAGGGLTYQWMRGGVILVDGGNISGATTSTLTIDPATSADADNDYNVIVTGGCSATSVDVDLVINVGPPIVTQPVNTSVCPGDAATFTVTASGPVLVYQWMRGGVALVDGGNISGAATSTLTIDPVNAGDAGTDYSVVVSGGACSTESVDVSLIMNASPAITVQPVDATVCEGTAATLSVTATGTGVTYQWMRGGVNITDGGNISGATTATLTIDPVTMGDDASDYTVMVSGTCPAAVTSADVDLTVTPATVISVQPVNQAVCEGNPVSFSVTANGTAPLNYQWMRGGVALADGGNISGSATSTLTIDPAMTADAGTDYSVMITGTCPSVSSADVTLTINTAPAITVVPADQSVCEGSAVTFTVVATGTGLTYQWRRGGVNMTDNTTVSGSTTASMTISPVAASDAANNYNVIVTGACPSAVTSANIELTISPSPIITVQPLSQTVCEGDAATYTVTATGAGLTYQWRQGSVNMVDGPRISGATTATLTIDPVMAADAAMDYNVVVTGTCPASSVDVALNVNTAPVITVQPVSQTLCPGQAATFSVTATGTNLNYQWTSNGSNLANGGSISGATTSTLTIDPVDASHVGANYNVIITGTCPTPVTSANFSLALNTPPAITVQAVDQSVCEGSAATFTVTATGTNLTYQWRQGSNNMVDGARISGATTSSMTINPTTAGDGANNYNVVVSGSCPGSVTSEDFVLTVNAVPVADASSNTDLCVGADIMLTAEGVSGASYSWSGPDGYTSADQNPTIASSATVNSGTYTLTVTSNGCSATDAVDVLVNDCDIVALSVPEGFSPNGDNINDFFVIDGIENYTDSKFVIFNRWGDEVFKGESYMNSWDGKGPNGEILPVGVYFYILELGDGSEDKKGTIYLNK